MQLHSEVKTIYNQNSKARLNEEHLEKVMEARRKKNLPYSLVYCILEEGKLKAVVLADPITKNPTFALNY